MQTINYGDQIPGLILIKEFVTPEEEASLIEAVDQQQWAGLGIPPNPELKRRTQQYGHLFSYRYRLILIHASPFLSVKSTKANEEKTKRINAEKYWRN